MEFASAALRYNYSFREYHIRKNGGEDEIVDCPHCFHFGYVIEEGKCVICDESAAQECSRCGCTIPPEEISDGDMCGYCQHMWDKVCAE